MRKTAKDLREEARRLLRKAEEIEKARVMKIGNIVTEYEKNNFANFSIEVFQKKLKEI